MTPMRPTALRGLARWAIAAVVGLSAIPAAAQSPSQVEAAITLLQHGRESRQAELIIGGLRALQLLQPPGQGRPSVHLVGADGGDPDDSIAAWISEARFLARANQSDLARIDRLEAAGIARITIGSVSLEPGLPSQITLIAGDWPITIGSMHFGAGTVRFSTRGADGAILCPRMSAPHVARCLVGKRKAADGKITIDLEHEGDRSRMVWLYAY
ncbi:MAG: hypothetical protein R3E00_01260 [Paracoccaceae bacterium]